MFCWILDGCSLRSSMSLSFFVDCLDGLYGFQSCFLCYLSCFCVCEFLLNDFYGCMVLF